MNIAETIAQKFENDGSAFFNEEDDLVDLCEEESMRTIYKWNNQRVKYKFTDGSSIVQGADWWDFALDPSDDVCMCLSENGQHEMECQAVYVQEGSEFDLWADWSDASCMIMYRWKDSSSSDWEPTVFQVADAAHDRLRALDLVSEWIENNCN